MAQGDRLRRSEVLDAAALRGQHLGECELAIHEDAGGQRNRRGGDRVGLSGASGRAAACGAVRCCAAWLLCEREGVTPPPTHRYAEVSHSPRADRRCLATHGMGIHLSLSLVSCRCLCGVLCFTCPSSTSLSLSPRLQFSHSSKVSLLIELLTRQLTLPSCRHSNRSTPTPLVVEGDVDVDGGEARVEEPPAPQPRRGSRRHHHILRRHLPPFPRRSSCGRRCGP